MAIEPAVGAAPPADLIAQIHFVGADQISADTNSAAITNFFCSAEARALAGQTLDKLSRAPGVWFKSKIATGAAAGAAQLRPLLDDLLRSEWILKIRDTTNGSPESALAIRLDNQRAQLWRDNLAEILQSWTHLPAGKTSNGWLLKKDLPPNLICLERQGDWLVIDCGQDHLSLRGEILPLPGKIAISETNWWSADLDWPRLARAFPPLKKFDFPGIELRVFGRDGGLWANGKLTLAQPLPPLEKWRMPTNVIHQPLVSFTAVRGIGSWLERQSWARPFEIQPPPDQLFIWALPQIPFQTFAAVPVPDATAALMELHAKLSAWRVNDSQNFFFTSIKEEMTNSQISWRGLPFISPFVQALPEPSGGFLFGGLFPNTPFVQSLPPELLQQLNKPNLVYYHWELTAERLKELPMLTQLLLLLTQHSQFDTQSAAGKWLNRIGPTLGPATTEVTQTGPNELTFSRKAPGGLTAIELIALTDWLETTNFPACGFHLAPPVGK
ncbi:MAG: hypothetical protein ABSA45_06860 [Verrucomicrobiota bacterium]